MSFFGEAADPRAKSARESAKQRAAAKRQKRVEQIAAAPASPPREKTIEKERATVANVVRRDAAKKKAEASGRLIKPRGRKSATKSAKRTINVSVYDRLKERPNDSLYKVEGGKIECRACNGKAVSLIKYRLEGHCNGKKHKAKLKKLLQTDMDDAVRQNLRSHSCSL